MHRSVGGAAASNGRTAKAMVADHLSQSIVSASNLVHLIRESSSAESLAKLPKELVGKTPNIKNTGGILEQMPRIITALDAHLDNGLESASQLDLVKSLLVNKEWMQQRSPNIKD
eukprot:c7946_g1_i1 orf=144-488(+)